MAVRKVQAQAVAQGRFLRVCFRGELRVGELGRGSPSFLVMKHYGHRPCREYRDMHAFWALGAFRGSELRVSGRKFS